jgi:hypothetical protein
MSKKLLCAFSRNMAACGSKWCFESLHMVLETRHQIYAVSKNAKKRPAPHVLIFRKRSGLLQHMGMLLCKGNLQRAIM